MINRALNTIVLIVSCITVFSQSNEFQYKNFIKSTDTLPYRILYPDDYNLKNKYPLVLFLHGSGERGNNNESQLLHGSSLFLNKLNLQKFPAIVVFPQCPTDGYWAPIKDKKNGFNYIKTNVPTEPMSLVIRLIKDLKKKEAIDTKRMYVMGLSMGGMGTLDLICRQPRTFAAAVSICGGVELSRLKKIKKMNLRLYHGADDNVVSPEHSRNTYIDLKANGSLSVEYIEFPNTNHNSWDLAFKQPDYLSWIFSKKLK